MCIPQAVNPDSIPRCVMAALYTIGLFYPAIPLPEGLLASGLPRRLRLLLRPEYTPPQFISHLWYLLIGISIFAGYWVSPYLSLTTATNGSGRARIEIVRLSRCRLHHFKKLHSCFCSYSLLLPSAKLQCYLALRLSNRKIKLMLAVFWFFTPAAKVESAYTGN